MTTTEIKTTKQAYQEATKRVMLRVMKLLEITEQEYAHMRYENGRAYLYWYLPVQDRERAILETSKLYWQWWKNLCNRHDYAFVTDTEIHKLTLGQRKKLYDLVHCPRTLAVECKIDSVVLTTLKIQKAA